MKADISKLHLEILDEQRQNLLNKLLPVVADFVMGGGTALSLQITHRLSFDFDFFSQKEIDTNFLVTLSKIVNVREVLVNSSDELTLMTSDNIKCTFLYYYFPNCDDLIEFDTGLKIFSVKEIAVKKAYTIGRRGVYRDYFDIYTIIKNGFSSIDEIIHGAKGVYQKIFNPKLFLEQLVYFKDLPDFEIMPIPNKNVESPVVVQEYLENIVKKYLQDNMNS